MGAFDDLICAYPLPVPGFEGRRFQTKSFDTPYMRLYTITPEGRLIVHSPHLEEVPEEERPGYQEYLETGQEWRLLMGCVRDAPPFDQDTNYHGDVVFYDFACPGDHSSGLVHFRARFVGGQVTGIEVVQPRPAAEGGEDEPR